MRFSALFQTLLAYWVALIPAQKLSPAQIYSLELELAVRIAQYDASVSRSFEVLTNILSSLADTVDVSISQLIQAEDQFLSGNPEEIEKLTKDLYDVIMQTNAVLEGEADDGLYILQELDRMEKEHASLEAFVVEFERKVAVLMTKSLFQKSTV